MSAIHPVWLELPYPPSVNTLYRTIVRGRRAFPIKSAEHRDYLRAVGECVGIVTPWPVDVELSITLKLYRPRRIGDIDNPIKALFDALNGRAWVDDSQVTRLVVERSDDKSRPRVEVTLAARKDET